MSLESIYYISQTSAVILLLVSVVFVGLQIRDNTRATRAASTYDVTKTWALHSREMAFHPSSASLASRALKPTSEISEFSNDEQSQLTFIIRSVLQMFYAQFLLYKEGSLPREYWELNGQYAASLLQLPTFKAIRSREESMGYLTKDFLDELSRLGGLHSVDFSSFSMKHEPE